MSFSRLSFFLFGFITISETFVSLEANAGALTNFEVLDFLRSKGAAKDSSRVLAKVAPSEYKVFDYLVETAACKQNREIINEFLNRFPKDDLAKAELLNIINIRPSSKVGIYSIIEMCGDRFEDEKEGEKEGEKKLKKLVKLVESVVESVLPPLPTNPEPEEGEPEEGKSGEAIDE